MTMDPAADDASTCQSSLGVNKQISEVGNSGYSFERGGGGGGAVVVDNLLISSPSISTNF